MTSTITEGQVAPARRKVGVALGIGILLLPVVFAWFTLRRGYSGLARAVSFVWLVLSFMIGVATTSPHVVAPPTAPVTDASLPSQGDGAASAAAAADASTPKLDLAAYNRIKTGMSYKTVRAIVGVDGEEQSSSDLAGIRTAAYTWRNSDGSNMMLMFQNGRLAQKAQFGLK